MLGEIDGWLRMGLLPPLGNFADISNFCLTNVRSLKVFLDDGNVRLHILSLIPDNFQGVTEIVSDGLPKPSRVNIVTKENL